MYKSEQELQEAVEAFFRKYRLPHVSQPVLKSGNNPDIGLLTSNGGPFGCIEIKRGLTLETQLGELADHMEQCVKYQRETGAPIFLGPWFSERGTILEFGSRGKYGFSPTAAFQILAGRVNIGMFIIHTDGRDGQHDYFWTGFTLLMRGQRVAAWDAMWPPDDRRAKWPTHPGDISMASTPGSAASSKKRKNR